MPASPSRGRAAVLFARSSPEDSWSLDATVAFSVVKYAGFLEYVMSFPEMDERGGVGCWLLVVVR